MGIGILKALLSSRRMICSCGDESSVDSDVNLAPVPDELMMFPNGFLSQSTSIVRLLGLNEF